MRSIVATTLTLGICVSPIGAAEREDAEAQLARAGVLREEGKATAAEKLLEGLLGRAPDHAAARLMLAEILADRRDWKQADGLLAGLSGRTLGYPLHHVRGKVSLELGRTEEARRDIEKALRYRPRSGIDLFLLGNAHAGARRWALAIDAYTRAKACGHDDAALHLGLARAYFARRTYLGKVTTKKLRNADPHAIVSGHYVLAPEPGRPGVYQVCPPASAVYQVAAARRLGCRGVAIDLLEADIWLAAERFDRARSLYAAAEPAIDKGQAASFYERFGRACLGVGDTDRHLRMLRKAAELDPKAYRQRHADAHTTAADRAAAAGDLQRALYHLKQAVAAAPKSAELRRRLGDAFAEQDEVASAEKHWREALRLRPDHPDRREILRRLERAATGTDEEP